MEHSKVTEHKNKEETQTYIKSPNHNPKCSQDSPGANWAIKGKTKQKTKRNKKIKNQEITVIPLAQ